MYQLKTYIVEDSPRIRASLIAALEELVPVRVVGVAEDEFVAVQWLTQPDNQVDLAIVDIFLKSGSGLGILRAVSESAKRYKLVVLSNFATSEIRLKCLALGAHRVFDKSNEVDALISYCGQLAAEHNGDSGNRSQGIQA
jgi:DNA-binding NarL/FixJ family response regulator